MPSLMNLERHTFGRLTVIGRAKNRGKQTYWNCICQCGNITAVAANSLRSGNAKSCGCLRKETSAALASALSVTHGKTNTRLHAAWRNMRYRCNNPNAKAYPRYGGRGISICKEWESFQAFEQWAIKNGYEDSLSLDRIDNDGDYRPSNCRWATWSMQNNNKCSNHFLTHDGKTLSVSQWAHERGVNVATLFSRIRKELPIEEILQ